jgi:hypothetical protein
MNKKWKKFLRKIERHYKKIVKEKKTCCCGLHGPSRDCSN